MSTMREISRLEFTTNGTVEHINAGSLQRIADATEKLVGDWGRLQHRVKVAEAAAERYMQRADRIERQNRALRGVITKLRRKLTPPPSDGQQERP